MDTGCTDRAVNEKGVLEGSQTLRATVPLQNALYAKYTVSQKKNCANLFFFVSELRQISTNFDKFWQKDGKEAEIM